MNHRFYIWLAGILFVIIVATIFIAAGERDRVRQSDKQYLKESAAVDMENKAPGEDNMSAKEKQTPSMENVKKDASSPSNDSAAAENPEKVIEDLNNAANDLTSEFTDIENEANTLQDLGSDTDTGTLGNDLDILSQ